MPSTAAFQNRHRLAHVAFRLEITQKHDRVRKETQIEGRLDIPDQTVLRKD